MPSPRRSLPTTDAIVADVGTPTPRKKPHCKKCGKPMKDHDKELCSRLASNHTDEDDTERSQNLLNKLSAMRLEDAQGKDRKETVTRTRRRSSVPVKIEYCPSISESQAAALDHLGTPGMMRDTICEEDKQYHAENIEKWTKAIGIEESHTPVLKGLRSPRPSLMESNTKNTDRILQEISDDILLQNHTDMRSEKPPTQKPKKAETDEFLTWLERKARLAVATAYTIAVDDIPVVESAAKRLKFFAKVLVPKYSNGKTKDALLVLGRDGDSVEELFKRVECEVTSNGRNGSGSFSQLLMGGAFGAIAT